MAACRAETQQKLDQLGAAKTETSDARPGMRLVREWNGTLHVVTIGEDGSIIWNEREWEFAEPGRTRDHRDPLVGSGLLRPQEAQSGMNYRPLRDLHPQVERRGAGAGFQLARCPA